MAVGYGILKPLTSAIGGDKDHAAENLGKPFPTFLASSEL
jgi:hypothetical protein